MKKIKNKMRVAIIGHLGGGKIFFDGQTIKTKALYDGLTEQGISIDVADTYYIRKNPILFLGQLLKCLIRNKKVIVLLSSNGRKILFPFFAILGALKIREIYHDVIGGILADEVKKSDKYKNYISSFAANWVESHSMVTQLQQMGVQNVKYIPNFKDLVPIGKNDFPREVTLPVHFCTFSRVEKTKGISDAILAIEQVNRAAGQTIAMLDVYGPLKEEYRQEFENLLANGTHCKYCGTVPANKSVAVLKNYYMLLFPSFWEREGMPGTIIDAFFSGVPVLARRWKYCDEMIKDHYNGLVYDFDHPERLKDTIQYAVEHPELVLSMKANCLENAHLYGKNEVISNILREMHIWKEA